LVGDPGSVYMVDCDDGCRDKSSYDV